MNQVLFDRHLLALRKKRAFRQGAGERTFLAERICEDLGDRLRSVAREFQNALALGSPGGICGDFLRQSGQVAHVSDADILVPEGTQTGHRVVVDDELLPFASASFDLVVHLLALQETNDVPGTLAQIATSLTPDGLFLAAFIGGESLMELRQSLALAEEEISGGASPRVVPMIDVRQAGGLLQRAGFALPVVDADRLTVRYDTMFGLIRDLRNMGLTSVLDKRNRTPARRELFYRAAQIYADRFSDSDGRIRATFDIISLSGWKPHPSQPKPLRPGSAKHSLADALREDSSDKA